jgi:mevalonate kinase
LKSGKFYSRGKFLLSAEYFVLYGARALALPLKFGQQMIVREFPGKGILQWETYIKEELWFTARYRLKDLEVMECSDYKTALFIKCLLKAGGELQPEFNAGITGFKIRNYIDFDIKWGLGSSSTLVSNLSWWLEIDPYALYSKVFQGSGYDVFCARASQPILYQLKAGHPETQEIFFRPPFIENLYFVYLGKKQDSQESVRKFKEQMLSGDVNTVQISEITDAMIRAATLKEFLTLIHRHEEILASLLGLKMVKEELFPDFPGEIKSLGAWGGDFVMAGTYLAPEEVKDYFSRKNLPVVFKWQDIVY